MAKRKIEAETLALTAEQKIELILNFLGESYGSQIKEETETFIINEEASNPLWVSKG